MTKAEVIAKIEELEAAKPSYTVLMTLPDGKDLMRTWHIMCANFLLSPELRAALADTPDEGEKLIIYKPSPEYDAYLNARFHPKDCGLGSVFEYNGHKWRYEYSSFDDIGEFDVLWRPAHKAAPSESACAAVLREIEWINPHVNSTDDKFCPKCLKWEPAGHAPNCELAAALRGDVTPPSKLMSELLWDKSDSDKLMMMWRTGWQEGQRALKSRHHAAGDVLSAYINQREEELNGEIAAEAIGRNEFKESCLRNALAELHLIREALALASANWEGQI